MKQLSIFDKNSEICEPDSTVSKENHWTLFVDGAARNNPGPAGAGVCILKNNALFLKKGFFLGIRTNNQAEYLALLLGLFFLEKQLREGDALEIFSDSQLLVRQLKREYKVKHRDLIPLHAAARSFLQDKQYTVRHVMREHNTVADALANQGVELGRKNIPDDFEHFCLRYR